MLPCSQARMAEAHISLATKRRRPFGVYAIILLLLLSILSVYLEEVRTQGGGLIGGLLPNGLDLTRNKAISTSVTVVYALLVIGLLALRRWAWVAGMVLVGVGLGFNIWLYFRGNPQYPNMLLEVVLVFYLNQRDVQQAFRRRKPSQ